MRNIAISGIHTDVGKSCVSAALCYGFSYEYFKLVQAGSVTDESFIKKMSPETVIHSAGAYLQTPASPHVGILKENNNFNGLKIKIPKKNGVLVELAGGLYSPLDLQSFMMDYLSFYSLPTFLVSKNYLGSINHTALSIEALKSKNIEILGIIFSQNSDQTSEDYLKKHYKHLPFLNLNDLNSNFKEASLELKSQILDVKIKL